MCIYIYIFGILAGTYCLIMVISESFWHIFSTKIQICWDFFFGWPNNLFTIGEISPKKEIEN